MTNPNNAVGTNGAYGGRTSVNALNDILSSFNGRGIVSGWNCQASSGMTVTLGGVVGSRDVAIAEDNIGNKTTVNNISASPIEVTLPTAPTANNRIDLIVAYVANPPQGSATVVDNPSACGLIVVSSAVAANPSIPNDSAIRAAITADGATGTNAYYVVIAQILISAGISTITTNYITKGKQATGSSNIGNLYTYSSTAYNYGSSESTFATLTATVSGEFRCFAEFGIASNVSGSPLILKIKKNGTEIANQVVASSNTADRLFVCVETVTALLVDDIITATITNANATTSDRTRGLSLTKIGQ